MNAKRFSLWAAASLAFTAAASALESRVWTSTDGRTIQAELVRVDGEKVILKDKDGREMPVEKKKLSTGDLKYIEEFAPKGNSLPFGDKAAKPGPIANPGKTAKGGVADQKTYKMRPEKFEVGYQKLDILETPHFLVIHEPKAEAGDLGEIAERCWLDMAFFHPTFSQKFEGRRMPVFLTTSLEIYNDIGKWYSDNVRKSTAIKNAEETADSILATWSKVASHGVSIPGDQAESLGIFPNGRIFRMDSYDKGNKAKGVFQPFRVHSLEAQLLNLQTGGVQEFGSTGLFAIQTGHAYFKEIQITGRSETNTVRDDGGTDHKLQTSGGFDPNKNWATELKAQIRRDKIAPNLPKLFQANGQGATQEQNVLAYAFSRFLQSDTAKVAIYAKLMEQIDAANQIPALDDIAKLYGYADGKAMDVAWKEWMLSGEFK